MQYPHIESVGLTVVDGERVRWADLRKRLGQWWYGFALRMWGQPTPRQGMAAEEVERILAKMAKQCARHWPWKLVPANKE